MCAQETCVCSRSVCAVEWIDWLISFSSNGQKLPFSVILWANAEITNWAKANKNFQQQYMPSLKQINWVFLVIMVRNHRQTYRCTHRHTHHSYLPSQLYRRGQNGNQQCFILWAQVEWWLEHRQGWLVKPQWAGSVLGRVTRYEYQVLGSTSIPARLDTLVNWEPFSWLTSVGTTRNTVIRLGWSRIGLAVLNLHAAGVGLIGRHAVISGRYNKCHSLQLQNHYAHFPPLHHTHINAKHNRAEPVMGNGYGFRSIVCWPWQEKSCVIG